MFDALPIWLKNRRAGQRGCRQLWVSAWSLAPSPVPSGPAKPGSAWWGPGASAFLALWVITKVSGGADWDHPGPSDLQAHLPWGEGCRGGGRVVSAAEPTHQRHFGQRIFFFPFSFSESVWSHSDFHLDASWSKDYVRFRFTASCPSHPISPWQTGFMAGFPSDFR